MYDMSLQKELETKYNKVTLTLTEAASELGVGVNDIIEAINNKSIITKTIGKKTIIPISSLVTFLSNENTSNNIDSYVSSELTSTNENTEIVQEDVDMSKGSITYVKAAKLWLFQLDLGKTSDGKRIRKSKSFKTEDEAKSALAKELEKLNSQTAYSDESKSIINNTTKYHDYLNYYLSLELGRGTSRTRDGYFYAAQKITEGLGKFKLKDLTQTNIMDYLNKLKKKYAQSTLDKVYLFLNMTLRYAFETEIISKNPMKGISKPKTQKVNLDEYKAYTPDELRDIISAARFYPDLYPMILLLMNAGLRPGELRALRLEDVNFEKGTIYIHSAATFTIANKKIGDRPQSKEVISTTKSPYSIRTLTIPDNVVTALKEWREYINTCKAYKKARRSEFLFPNTNGKFLGDSVLRNRFKKFLRQEGFDGNGFTLYRFRHSMCTALIKSGVDIPTVQKIMGDSTTDVILKIYTHVNASDMQKASFKAHEYFASLQ